MFCKFCSCGLHGECSTSYCRCPMQECIRAQGKLSNIMKDLIAIKKVKLYNGQTNKIRIQEDTEKYRESGKALTVKRQSSR